MNYDELQAEIETINVIFSKIFLSSYKISLSEDEKDILEVMRDDKIALMSHEWEKNRIQEIVNILIPRYDWRKDKDKLPGRWPDRETQSWFNGATVEQFSKGDGFYELQLSSYLGRDNYASHVMKIPEEWLKLSNLEEFLKNLCQEKIAKLELEANTKRYELLKLQRDQLDQEIKKFSR